eukprot:c1670_g1_i1.p1 GENE.c1670_g1_i1~~c1670_g1_i1.p1  ORF type:complete len:177 (+),score=57.60 c1670_g1_i1:31-561(+)
MDKSNTNIQTCKIVPFSKQQQQSQNIPPIIISSNNKIKPNIPIVKKESKIKIENKNDNISLKIEKINQDEKINNYNSVISSFSVNSNSNSNRRRRERTVSPHPLRRPRSPYRPTSVKKNSSSSSSTITTRREGSENKRNDSPSTDRWSMIKGPSSPSSLLLERRDNTARREDEEDK